jgi:hypothetical protein
MGREDNRARFFAECEFAPRAVWAFEPGQATEWNVIATMFGTRDPPAARCALLTTDPAPRPGVGAIWLSPDRARRMRNDLLRALSADDSGGVWMVVAGIAFTVSEAEAIERVLAGALELMEAAHG